MLVNRFESIDEIFRALSKSKFRSKFRLEIKEFEYIERVGLNKIELHAKDFIDKRLSPSQPLNDGKQTPYTGHPVFIAQHATATCCRGCLEKWYGIPKNRILDVEEVDFVIKIIMEWIVREFKKTKQCDN